MKHELLSPAGNLSSMLAAINAGADAVYAGTDRFSARAYADNMSSEEFIFGIRSAHLADVKVYLALNTLIGTNEYEDAYKCIRPLYESGLDGIIVQDLGLIPMLKGCFPELKLHASTQMSVMSSYGAKLMKDQGFSRVVPARELTLNEIRHIKEVTGMEIECFIHGAMCYSYSGLCLMSSMIGARSGNRGRCAGTCRLPFDAIHNDKKLDDRRKSGEAYPLSMKDMCTLEILPELCEAGIDSFKIEGRMKSPEYVAGVTSIYRKYLDLYLEHGKQDYSISDEDMKHLNSLYIRTDISKGYYEGTKGRSLITLDQPGYNGNDPAYEQQINSRFVHEPIKNPVDMYVNMHMGEEASLTVINGDTCVTAIGDVVTEAIKAPLSASSVEERMKKTGDSPFAVSNIEVQIDENVFMPVSAMNSLRREALNMLEDELIKNNGYNTHLSAGELIFDGDEVTGKKVREKTVFDISVLTVDQLRCALDVRLDAKSRIFVDYDVLMKLDETEVCQISESDSLWLSLPVILRERSDIYDRIAEYIDKSPFISGVLVHTLDELAFASERLNDLQIITDTSVYSYNPASVKQITNMGRTQICGITYPYELNLKDLRALSAELSKSDTPETSMVVYGYIPMMISDGCIKKTYGICDHKKTVNRSLILKDRKNARFPVVTDCTICTNIIYNSLPLSLCDMMDDIASIDADRYRLSFTVESGEETARIIRAFFENGSLKDMKTTTGHMKRGAL
ncbi:MAG: U32 family peptidase [Lachnospiraceae bacterium]|nr:U32 family peptidase [Lachnospiraceae bacterium]